MGAGVIGSATALGSERYAHLVCVFLKPSVRPRKHIIHYIEITTRTDAYDRRKDVRFVRAIVLAGFAGIPALFFRRSPVIADPTTPTFGLSPHQKCRGRDASLPPQLPSLSCVSPTHVSRTKPTLHSAFSKVWKQQCLRFRATLLFAVWKRANGATQLASLG